MQWRNLETHIATIVIFAGLVDGRLTGAAQRVARLMQNALNHANRQPAYGLTDEEIKIVEDGS